MADKKPSMNAKELRRNAEKALLSKHAAAPDTSTSEERQQILHELRVHQIELEMQNEELCKSQQELEALRQRYFDLYDLAPVGYVTLSTKGLILQANLTAAGLLGVTKSELARKPLGRFILQKDEGSYYLYLKQLFEKGSGVCELRMLRKGAPFFWARLEAFVTHTDDGASECRIVFSDITGSKQLEQVQKKTGHDLAERVKELECLYRMSRIIEKQGITVEGICQELVSLIAASVQHPESACARIRLPGCEFKTPACKETPWKLCSPIAAGGRQWGELAIYYQEEKPEQDEGPFLKDERLLIAAVAERLGRVIERNQTEEALKESERKLRMHRDMLSQLLNSLPQSIFWKDHNSVYMGCNTIFARASGINSPEEIIGKTDFDLPWAHESAEAYQADDRDVMEHNRPRLHIIESLKQADGLCLWIDTSKVPLTDEKGTVYGVLGVYDDITERKRTEEALRENEQRFRSYFELPLIGIAIASPGKRWRECNDRLCEILGYEREELQEKTWAELIHPEDLAVTEEKFNLALSNKISQYKIERRFIRKDGSIVFTNSAVGCVRKPDGMLDYCVVLIEDITGRKQLEEQLMQSQKMEAIGTLAGGIAHDFNNILAGILSYTEILKGKVLQDTQLDYYLGQILLLVDRAANLVEQILIFSRKTGSNRKPLLLRPLIVEVLTLLRASLPSTIEIRQQLSDQELLVEADPTQIHQVLMNLCINAGHAMEKKSGALEIELTRVSLSSKDIARYKDIEPGNYAQLRVHDTGTGIDPAIISRIFDPFFTTKEVGKGTGLGLSVVHGIIKGHGGDITVTSEQGKGTTFLILLPEVSSAPAEVKQVEKNSDPLSGTERILFVDDEEHMTFTIKMLLEPLGYKVTTVQSSREALELFQKGPEEFDLVITDLTMPHITGYDLVRQLIMIRPDIPAILCTGYNENVLESKEEGIRAVLTKPFKRKALAETIRKVLDIPVSTA